MKQLYLLFLYCSILSGAGTAAAQSFTVAHDTVRIAAGTAASGSYTDSVINNTPGAINIQWKVIATDFPADWKGACSAFCDGNACYNMSGLWPAQGAQSFACSPGAQTFYMAMDHSCATSAGCYYLTVRMSNAAAPGDAATETFIVCKPAPAGAAALSTAADISCYPNPAINELNVVYGADADVKTISLYNIIGRLMTVYKVTGSTGANLNLAGIPAGAYFVRLMNTNGEMVATRRFSKQGAD